MANKTMNFGVDLLPTFTNIYNLGNADLKWNNAYINTIYGTVTKATQDGNGDEIASTYLKKSGGQMTGSIKRHYNVASTDPTITVTSNNQDITVLSFGHSSSAGNPSSHYYKFLYKGTGNTPNNYFQLISANNSEVIAMQVNEEGNVSFSNTVTANINGNAATATKFASAQSITLTGDITGTVSSQAGWSIATTIGQNKVTNNMLAGSIANAKLSNSKVTIAGNDVSLGGSITADTLRTSLGLSNAMHFIGKATVAITDGSTTDPAISGYSTKVAGDVVIDKDTSYEYVWTTENKWERLGPDSSYSLSTHTHGNITNDGKITSTATIANGDKLVIVDVDSTAGNKLTGSSITFDGSTTTKALTQKGTWEPFNNYSLPLAASGTRGGIKIGYSESGTNYAVKLSSEKAYVTVPWTDRYVNSASFEDDTTSNTNSPIKLTLTRAGSDSQTITANIPKVSSSGAGVVPKGAAVSSQSQSTKFLREDGTWATPSYSTYTLSGLVGSSAIGSSTKPVYWNGSAFVGITSYEGNAASASKLSNTSKIGDTNKPVYFTANGVPAAISYTIDKSVPSTAIFTDENIKQSLTSNNNNFPLLMSYVDNANTTADQTGNVYRNNSIYANPSTGSIYGSQVWGAVWNDYAEFRKDNVKEKELQQPGRCVREVGDGTLTLTDGRLQRGCEIISDTFGFAIGQNKENGYNTPIASSGRVLAYLYEDRELARNFIGWPVCSGPNGTVSIMTEEEENRYSNRIVGTISEIPDYEEWGTGKVKVDGRIWIRIK